MHQLVNQCSCLLKESSCISRHIWVHVLQVEVDTTDVGTIRPRVHCTRTSPSNPSLWSGGLFSSDIDDKISVRFINTTDLMTVAVSEIINLDTVRISLNFEHFGEIMSNGLHKVHFQELSVSLRNIWERIDELNSEILVRLRNILLSKSEILVTSDNFFMAQESLWVMFSFPRGKVIMIPCDDQFIVDTLMTVDLVGGFSAFLHLFVSHLKRVQYVRFVVVTVGEVIGVVVIMIFVIGMIM